MFDSHVSVEKVKYNFKKALTRKEHAHIVALRKAQASIDIAIEKQEIKDQQDEEENLLSKVKVRPKTPPYKEIGLRMETEDEFERHDKKQRAIILV